MNTNITSTEDHAISELMAANIAVIDVTENSPIFTPSFMLGLMREAYHAGADAERKQASAEHDMVSEAVEGVYRRQVDMSADMMAWAILRATAAQNHQPTTAVVLNLNDMNPMADGHTLTKELIDESHVKYTLTQTVIATDTDE